MKRLLMIVAMVLTAYQVSGQDEFGPTFQNSTPPKTYASPVEKVNFPYTELTQVRLWAPCNQRKDMQWWQLVRDHQGPGWKMVGAEMVYVEDRIYDHWIKAVPQQSAEERQPQTHTTIDVWRLRDQALREQELRGREEWKGKPKRLTEPVFRVPAAPEAPTQEAAFQRPR